MKRLATLHNAFSLAYESVLQGFTHNGVGLDIFGHGAPCTNHWTGPDRTLVSRFTVLGNETRTPLADFFSILLNGERV
jgi:hypothetical protein